ncbi:MAG: Txe/YoeB family addiction module toxin [Anaerococcus prevotii]|uniref:Txe/YoeB family addiction module toxin n=1 Tax=Anaerococcus prevotii TaxID=33034 RepID=UPI0028FE4AC4|nr:Txe/YoeB family addiction module toxin [Anaerococcus prevotii]MDU2558078.1 Txe/YoeB family addiction module toxin [Anaerococcus prevotii]
MIKLFRVYGFRSKPEALKNNLSGLWSRRIDKEHRIVYLVEGDCLVIFQCKGHYN